MKKQTIVKSKLGLRRWDEILNRIPSNRPIRGAEIGIWKGCNAREIIRHRPNVIHIMVDPWSAIDRDKSFVESGSEDSKVDQKEYNRCYDITLIRVNPWIKQCEIMKMKSVDAAELIADNSLDYVFIDADHSYAGVKQDIELWYPKIKLGGWIGGHDYDKRFPGLIMAVKESFDKEIETGGDMTWFVRK